MPIYNIYILFKTHCSLTVFKFQIQLEDFTSLRKFSRWNVKNFKIIVSNFLKDPWDPWLKKLQNGSNNLILIKETNFKHLQEKKKN